MTAPIRPAIIDVWTLPARLRHALIGLAGDTDAMAAPGAALARYRIAFDLAFDGIEARRAASGSIHDYIAANVRLTDSAVAGLLHMARAAVDGSARSMVAPLACVAIGNYGTRLPAPLRLGGLLLLLPQDPDVRSRGEKIADFIAEGLVALGLDIETTARTVPALGSLVATFPSLMPMIERRRFIRGRYDLFVQLDREAGRLRAMAATPPAGEDFKQPGWADRTASDPVPA